MGDPYKILGVSADATEEQVKAAYRELAKKYHPDNYADSPLADLATEKMQEINEAYDTVIQNIRNRKSGSYSNASYGNASYGSYRQAGYNSYQSQYGASSFSDIRQMIQQRRLAEAEELLDGTPAASRDAEWYFLKGTIYYQRGWLDDAMNYFSSACKMNPNNPEYQAALNRMMWQQQGHTGSRNGNYRNAGNYGCAGDPCDCCSSMICADCCCECMGGDLIPCC